MGVRCGEGLQQGGKREGRGELRVPGGLKGAWVASEAH